jgi:hypothetical protein
VLPDLSALSHLAYRRNPMQGRETVLWLSEHRLGCMLGVCVLGVYCQPAVMRNHKMYFAEGMQLGGPC